jgi:hypothetical protein
MSKTRSLFITILGIGSILSGAISGCTPAPTVTPASTLPAPTATGDTTLPPTRTPLPAVIPTSTPAPIPIPVITLNEGDLYFSVDGQQGFLFSRNLAGWQTSQYSQLLDLTAAGGSKLVRVQLDSLGMGYSNTGQVDDAWAKNWEQVFDKAASDGIDVIPVFSGWFDWNDGTGYSTWNSNPLNSKNGGPVKTGLELFTSGSPTQKLWLGWMEALIGRWQGRKNIIAWEVFSEINMVPGATEPAAIDFVNNAALVIQNADPSHRPLTASLADFGSWTNFYRSDSLDFINLHPYPVSGKLDSTIMAEVRSMLAAYRKPVLIGESGLSFLTPDTNPPTLTTAARAEIGIAHAIWAAVVSGAMNGRSLYWEDGFGVYFPALNIPWIKKYANADLPASNFVRGVDFANFQPLASTSGPEVWGGVLGSEKMALGWYRDAACEPPDWNLKPQISGQTIILTVSGTAPDWQVDFYDTKTGTGILSTAVLTRSGDKLTIPLPDFVDDIAFKLYPK